MRAGHGPAPTANLEASLLFVGTGPRPARWLTDKFPRCGGRGKSLSPLSRCARHLPLIRGVVPSPTVFKKFFQGWVGEALGPPADPWKPGGPVCRPYMYPEAILFYRRGRTLAGPHTRRVQEAAPYSPAPTAPARPSQARKWNRTSPNFPHSQGPVARREFRAPLRFCAPEILQNLTSTRPPQWGF